MLEIRLVPPVLGLGCCSGYRNGFILTSASLSTWSLHWLLAEKVETLASLRCP